jgi:hypothetical protein
MTFHQIIEELTDDDLNYLIEIFEKVGIPKK